MQESALHVVTLFFQEKKKRLLRSTVVTENFLTSLRDLHFKNSFKRSFSIITMKLFVICFFKVKIVIKV